jgi:hypothetical protein
MAKRHAPATERNRDPIVEVLAGELPQGGKVLEVASGTGEHAVFFAGQFPALEWQASDPDVDALASIAAWRADYTGQNLAEPVLLDASAPDSWPVNQADAMVCINMLHISHWAATEGLFAGGARLLAQSAGPIILYGPYIEAAVETAPSNLQFDASLRLRNPAWGLRDTGDVDVVAAAHGYARSARYAMPANNLMLIYRPTS